MSYQTIENAIAGALNYQFVSASATITTTSTAFVATGIQITILESGTYWLVGSVVGRIETGNQLDKRFESALFSNGTQLTNTVGKNGAQLTGVSLAQNATIGTIVSIGVFNLNAGDIIQLGVRRSAGNSTVNFDDRTLMSVKVG